MMPGGLGMPGGGMCDCGPCSTSICVEACTGSYVDGATVQIKSGATVIGTGTTSGVPPCCTITIPSAGSYTVVISGTNLTTHTSTQTLACNSTVTINVNPSSLALCCGDCIMNNTIYLTDVNGTIALTYDGIVTWRGCYTVSVASTVPNVHIVGGNCVCETATTSDVVVFYSVICNTGPGGSPTSLTVTRDSPFFECSIGVYNYFGAVYAPISASCGPALGCGSAGLITSSTLTQNVSSCTPFAWSGTLVFGGALLADLVGGTVSLSN